jgi:hypothetical protein
MEEEESRPQYPNTAVNLKRIPSKYSETKKKAKCPDCCEHWEKHAI